MNELLREVRAAAREVADACRALDMAAPDYVDAAVHRVNAAQARYSALLRELRRGHAYLPDAGREFLERRLVEIFGEKGEKNEGLHRDQG